MSLSPSSNVSTSRHVVPMCMRSIVLCALSIFLVNSVATNSRNSTDHVLVPYYNGSSVFIIGVSAKLRSGGKNSGKGNSKKKTRGNSKKKTRTETVFFPAFSSPTPSSSSTALFFRPSQSDSNFHNIRTTSFAATVEDCQQKFKSADWKMDNVATKFFWPKKADDPTDVTSNTLAPGCSDCLSAVADKLKNLETHEKELEKITDDRNIAGTQYSRAQINGIRTEKNDSPEDENCTCHQLNYRNIANELLNNSVDASVVGALTPVERVRVAGIIEEAWIVVSQLNYAEPGQESKELVNHPNYEPTNVGGTCVAIFRNAVLDRVPIEFQSADIDRAIKLSCNSADAGTSRTENPLAVAIGNVLVNAESIVRFYMDVEACKKEGMQVRLTKEGIHVRVQGNREETPHATMPKSLCTTPLPGSKQFGEALKTDTVSKTNEDVQRMMQEQAEIQPTPDDRWKTALEGLGPIWKNDDVVSKKTEVAHLLDRIFERWEKSLNAERSSIEEEDGEENPSAAFSIGNKKNIHLTNGSSMKKGAKVHFFA